MDLKIERRFVYLPHRKAMYLADYSSGIESGGCPLSLNDFDKTSYALKVLNDEIEAAMKGQTNDCSPMDSVRKSFKIRVQK